MALTFNVGGVYFEELDSSVGRKAMACRVHVPQYQKIRFHVPGSDGNFVIRGGRSGGKILIIARYIGVGLAPVTMYNADRDAWANTAVTITDEVGSEYQRCNVGSMARMTDPVAMGRGGKTYIDVQAEFDYDG